MDLNRSQKFLDKMFDVIQTIFPFVAAVVIAAVVYVSCHK